MIEAIPHPIDLLRKGKLTLQQQSQYQQPQPNETTVFKADADPYLDDYHYQPVNDKGISQSENQSNRLS